MRDGANGMVEESRRPRSDPESLEEEELCRIVELKLAYPNWGPRKIHELYHRQHGRAGSESSCKRVLDRTGNPQDNGAHERLHRGYQPGTPMSGPNRSE